MERIGWVTKVLPEKVEEYVKLHAVVWPGVLAMIKKCNIQNYSIFLKAMPNGERYLFSYLEYVGDDFEADMKKMADDPDTQRWWKETDPCQRRIPGTPEGQQWMRLPEVFHTD